MQLLIYLKVHLDPTRFQTDLSRMTRDVAGDVVDGV